MARNDARLVDVSILADYGFDDHSSGDARRPGQRRITQLRSGDQTSLQHTAADASPLRRRRWRWWRRWGWRRWRRWCGFRWTRPSENASEYSTHNASSISRAAHNSDEVGLWSFVYD